MDKTNLFYRQGLSASWQVPLEQALPDGGNTVYVQAQNYMLAQASTLSGFSVTMTGTSPGISALQPDFGFVGDTVTITGSNFSNILDENNVTFFNGVKAEVSSASSTSWWSRFPGAP